MTESNSSWGEFFNFVSKSLILFDSLRGSFDGGRSQDGVGCGWVVDVNISYLAPSLSSSEYSLGWRRVASEAFLLPSSQTITSAELSAAHRLLSVGVLGCLKGQAT